VSGIFYLRHNLVTALFGVLAKCSHLVRQRVPCDLLFRGDAGVKCCPHPDLLAFMLAAYTATLSGSYSHPAPVFTARIFLSFARLIMY
jgi:hypothetical protein